MGGLGGHLAFVSLSASLTVHHWNYISTHQEELYIVFGR